MTKTRRWLKAALASAAEPQIALPWQRGSRRRPEALKSTSPSQNSAPRLSAIAAR